MTNFEKYHEEMIEKKYRAVKNGKPISCKSVGCSECEHYDEDSTLLKWLAKEYKEQNQKLTEKEMYLCKAFNSGYIARDMNGDLYFYASKPEKGDYVWRDNGTMCKIPPISCFSFIKWEDKEPHSIEDMLKWEVKEYEEDIDETTEVTL